MHKSLQFAFLTMVAIVTAAAQQSPYQYLRIGKSHDAVTRSEFGVALMGGGADLDEAFQWMCAKSGGGDFLVLRATGDDDYNPYIEKLCHLNSVATLIIPNRDAAMDPAVAGIISKSEALFIAGGDQSNYVKYWKGTPVQEAINRLIRRGIPVGGTSAGLAVLGQFSFSALNDSAYSNETLRNPYNERVTIADDFLDVPQLKDTITDSHFVRRDRQGRFLGFMARILADGMAKRVRGIGVDEKSAALMDANGIARVVGPGKGAYFYRSMRAAEICSAGKPLTFRDIQVWKVPSGVTFDIAEWKSTQGGPYVLNVVDGKITTTRPDGAVY